MSKEDLEKAYYAVRKLKSSEDHEKEDEEIFLKKVNEKVLKNLFQLMYLENPNEEVI